MKSIDEIIENVWMLGVEHMTWTIPEAEKRMAKAKEQLLEAVLGALRRSSRKASSSAEPHLDSKPTASDVCTLSKRVDGKLHSWEFDGDDPNIICYYCGEVRRSGMVIQAGRGSSSVAVSNEQKTERSERELVLSEVEIKIRSLFNE